MLPAMRSEHYRMDAAEARRLLAEADVVHLAGVTAEGRPVLRALHPVTMGEALYFHASPSGEKTALVGRPVVVQAETLVARIPSWFVDPERACPATTYFRSVQAHGVLEAVDALDEKAAALQALMARRQPEGGYVPIAADGPLYRAAVKNLLVLRLVPERVDGKAKLGQNRSPEQITRVLAELWRRGDPGDVEALELVAAANPEARKPACLYGPLGTTLSARRDPETIEAALALVDGEYWTEGVPVAGRRVALERSLAWVGAFTPEGRLVAMARAASDGARFAWIADVVVAAELRGHGLGTAVTRALLDHPAVREVRRLMLGTRDAEAVYARLGFVDAWPVLQQRGVHLMLR